LRSLSSVEREVRDNVGKTYLLRVLPYRTIDDKIDGIVVTFIDITERKRAEASKFFLAAIVESSADAVSTIDFDGNITSWNKGAETLYGHKAAEVLGKPLSLVTLPEDLKELVHNAERIKQTGTAETHESIRVQKDGETLVLEVTLSPVRDGQKEVIGVSMVARDVTERRRREEKHRFMTDINEDLSE